MGDLAPDPTSPEGYLRGLAPFDRLDDARFAAAARDLEVTYVAARTRVLARGGPPADHLYVVRKGTAVRSRDGVTFSSVEAGEWFGTRSVLTGAPPVADIEAVDDLLLYRLPAATVRDLVDAVPAFAAELAGVADRLRRATDAGGATRTVPVADLLRRDLVRAEPGADVATVAARMRDHEVSSVILDGDPTAIVTARDLRDRVLAAGLGPDIPASRIASRPLLTVPADAPLGEARDLMLEHAVHHLGVTDAGELVGVLTAGDLLRAEAVSPLHVQRAFATAPRGGGGQVPEHLHRTVERLLDAGTAAREITRTVSMLTDVLVRRAVELAVERHGPPPVAFAWVTLGSDARREQTVVTDQDHALVHDPVDADGQAWFALLAEDVVTQLEAAGLPRCQGEVMATRWHDTVAGWSARLDGWFDRPDPQGLLETAIFLDRRRVAGTAPIDALDQVVRARRGDRVLLARMAAAAARGRPPLGPLHRLRADADGTVDLKRGGTAPVVAVARVLAIEAGSTATATDDRLQAAVVHGGLSEDAGEELREAFAFLQTARLQLQLRAWRAGAPLDNRLELEGLTAARRRHLKDALVTVARIQRAVVTRLGGDDVAW